MFVGFTFLPVYFQSVMHDSAFMAGVKLFPLVLAFLLGSFIGSAILQKTGKIGHLIPLGAIFLTLGLGLLGLVTPETNFGEVAGFELFYGLGIGCLFSLMSVTLQNSVQAEQMGVVMSAFAFFQLLGGSLGVAIIGALINHWTAAEMLQYPSNPVLALCLALDNVFVATIAPGIAVIILAVLIQNVDLKLPNKKVDEMDTLEKGKLATPVHIAPVEEGPKKQMETQDEPETQNAQAQPLLAAPADVPLSQCVHVAGAR